MGCVWDNLLTRWCKQKPDWDFYHVCWQSAERPHKTVEGYTKLPRKNVAQGYDTVVENIRKYNPDVLLTLCDVGFQSGFIEQVKIAKQMGWKGKWIAYTPVDTESWPHTWSTIFNYPDVNVAMAQFGEKQMNKYKVPNVVRIDHGVDLETFKPVEDRQALKTKYGFGEKFTIGFVGRNQRRKMLANLIKAFSIFAKDKDDVSLVLHTDAEPAAPTGGTSESAGFAGWSLPFLQEKYDVATKMALTKGELNVLTRQSITPAGINEIFNLMDVFCFATGGEGFGLPGIECQAAGCPIMMTESTTGHELTEGHGWRIPTLKDEYGDDVTDIGTNGVEFVYPNHKFIADKLEELYKDWKEGGKILKEESKKSIDFAQGYNWDDLAPKWIELFESE